MMWRKRQFKKLRKYLQHEQWEYRFAAIRKLAKYKLARTEPLLLRALKDESHYVRREAAAALRKSRNIHVIERLLNALNDEDAMVRGKAAATLQQLCPLVQTIIFGQGAVDVQTQGYTLYNPDLFKLTARLSKLKQILVYVETCDVRQVEALAHYMRTFLPENILKKQVIWNIYGNPLRLNTAVYQACHRCKTVDVSITTVSFGKQQLLPETPKTMLSNPDVTSLTIPLPRLNQLLIHTATANVRQIEYFLTYVLSYMGQNYLKNHVDVELYGNLEQLPVNLRNNLTNLCRSVHIYAER
jgi:hypothetical protein